MEENKNTMQGDSAGQSATSAVSKKRRKVLKGASAAAVAGAVWHKPTLDAIVLPSHAQTSPSMAIAFNGATGTTAPVTKTNAMEAVEGVAKRIANAIVPEANAGLNDSFSGTCGALVDDMYSSDNYGHCVSVNLPDGEDVNGSFTLDLTGPDVYYNYYCYYEGAYYYEGVTNFSGSAMSTMSNRQIDVVINGMRITGEVAEDFSGASGLIVNDSNAGLSPINSNYDYCDIGYGAYWSVDLSGGTCSIGSGVNTAYPIALGSPPCGD